MHGAFEQNDFTFREFILTTKTWSFGPPARSRRFYGSESQIRDNRLCL